MSALSRQHRTRALLSGGGGSSSDGEKGASDRVGGCFNGVKRVDNDVRALAGTRLRVEVAEMLDAFVHYAN